MRNCVIHQECVVTESRLKENTKKNRNKALTALSVIDDIIRSDPKVVVLKKDQDAELVANFFEPGEVVILYGAYLDGCLDIAYQYLKSKGVEPMYHATGCIPLFL